MKDKSQGRLRVKNPGETRKKSVTLIENVKKKRDGLFDKIAIKSRDRQF